MSIGSQMIDLLGAAERRPVADRHQHAGRLSSSSPRPRPRRRSRRRRPDRTLWPPARPDSAWMRPVSMLISSSWSLVLQHVGHRHQRAALHRAVGRLRAREEVAQLQMRVVLVEDVLAALRDPDTRARRSCPRSPRTWRARGCRRRRLSWLSLSTLYSACLYASPLYLLEALARLGCASGSWRPPPTSPRASCARC